MKAKITPEGKEMSDRVLLWIIVYLLAFLVGFSVAHGAEPQWSDDRYKQFYSELKGNNGVSCCDVSDCSWTVLEERATPDGGFKAFVLELNAWIDVRPEIVIRDRPNPTGHPILCMSEYKYQYCYMEGAGM